MTNESVVTIHSLDIIRPISVLERQRVAS